MIVLEAVGALCVGALIAAGVYFVIQRYAAKPTPRNRSK